MNIFAFLLFSLIPILSWSASAPQLPAPPSVSAKSFILYDYNSNQILLQNNADARIDPTSFNKLMTAYVVMDAVKHSRISLDQVMAAPPSALKMSGSDMRMFLRADLPVTVEELLNGLLVSSGNDAAITLAIGTSGSEEKFVAQMNEHAKRIGMLNTVFSSPTGIGGSKQYSNANDLVVLAAALLRDFPQLQGVFAKRENTFNGIAQMNRNRLLWLDPFADGLFIAGGEYGYNAIGTAVRDKHRLIAIVLGAPSDALRATESQKLLNYGFQRHDLVRLYKKGDTVAKARIWHGIENELDLVTSGDLFVTIPKGSMGQIKANVERPKPLFAPISAGQKIGTLKLSLAGKPYVEFPLFANSSIATANVFSRGWDGIRLFFGED